MEVHAVSGGWVLEWSGCTGSSIVKATVGVAGFLVVASGVVQGVRHRSLRWYSHKGRLARDNIKEPDATVSNQATKELEGEIGSASQAADNQQVAMATARASDLPLLDVSGVDSPRSRIGRGLESIGGMTAGTLQRLSTVVGGVVKSPAVLMAKVGGLASPRAAALTAPPGSSLEERVFHLEIQMKSFEEKFSSRIVVTKLVKRVQMLEDCVNERMERIEKALSSIHSQLDHVEFNKCESGAGYEHQESLVGEPQYYDAEQQSDNFEALEAFKHNFFVVHDVLGEATGGSHTFEKSLVKEASSAAPTIVEHVEIDVEKNDDFLEPQVVSTSVYSKEAFLTQPMKSVSPSSKLVESFHRDDAGNFLASLDRQLASTLEEFHGSFVTQSSTIAASTKFLEIAQADMFETSTLAHATLEPQSSSVLEEPQEAFLEEPTVVEELATQEDSDIAFASSEPLVTSKSMEEPSVVAPSANSREPTQKDTSDKSVTMTTTRESPKAFAFQDPNEDFIKESLASALGDEPSSQEDSSTTSDVALASFMSPTASKSIEEPSTSARGARFEKPTLGDAVDKSGNTIAIATLPLVSSLEESQKECVKEFVAIAPSAEFAQEFATQEDNDMQVMALESPMASKFVEEPSVAAPSADSKELAQEDVAKKTTMAITKSSLASSLEEPKEGFGKESMASAPSGKLAQEHSNMAVASFEIEGASKFEEASIVVPSAKFGEHAHKDDANTSCTIILGAELPLASSFDNPQEDFEKESLATTLSAKPVEELAIQEDGSMVLTTPETMVIPKFAEDPSIAIASAGFEEPIGEDVDKGITMIAIAESPSSHQGLQENFQKESLVVVPIHEPSLQEDLGAASDKALASSEPQVASKFVEEPSLALASANFEEPAYEDEIDKTITLAAIIDLPLASSYQGLQEDFVKESLPTAPSARPVHEISSLEDLHATSDVALASSEPFGGSKFVEETSLHILNANSEELTQEDGVVKNDTMIASIKPPLASSLEEPQEDFEKESLAATSNHEPAQRLTMKEDSHMVPTSSESQEASKSMEEPLAIVPSADFEELAHQDAAEKSIAMNTTEVSPFGSSFQRPQEDFEKESIAAIPNTKLVDELETQEDSHMAPSKPQMASKFVEEPSTINVPSAKFEEPTYKDTIHKSATKTTAIESPSVSSLEDHREDNKNESLVAGASAKVLEPIEEDAFGKNPIAFAPFEAPSTSSFGIPQEAFSKEPTRTSGQSEKLAQEKSGIVDVESTLTSTMEEGNYEAKESEYKLAEDFKVHDEHIKSIAKEFPRSQRKLAHVSSDELKPKSLAAHDNDDLLESDQSGEEFFDVEHDDGNFEPWELDEPKSFKEFSVDLDELGEATESNVVAQKDTLVPTSSMEPIQEPEQAPVQEPEQAFSRELEQDHESIEQAFVQEQEQQAMQEQEQHAHGQQPLQEQEPKQEPAQEHGQEYGQAPAEELEEPTQECGQQPVQEPIQESRQQPVQEPIQECGQQPTQELAQKHGHEPEQQYEQLAQETELEDLNRNSAMALLPSELQVTSKSGECDELLVEEPLAIVPSTKFEEPTEENAADESGTHGLPLTSTAKVPQIDTIASLEKNLSSASFHQSGTHEILENLVYKSLGTLDTSSTPQEALERETTTATPTTNIAQGHDAGKIDNLHILLEPQLEESKEALANELMKAVPSSESTQPTQGVDDGQNIAILASSKLQWTPTLQEPQEGFVKEPLADAESTSKFVDLEESLANKPSTIATSAKLAQESIANKFSVGLVEEPPLTSIAEEPQNGSMSSLVEGKHGQDKVDQKFLDDVKVIAESVKEAIPRIQSDLTHVKLKLEAVEDASKLQSQGSFLAFGATSVDSKEDLVREPLPYAKLLELFEEENNLGKRDPMLVDSQMTSTMEEPQKPLAKESLSSAKSVPKGHARRRGFARSSSEPQFAYKLEEHRKALVKESSMVVVPSASKLGEGKHPKKESDFKLVENVKSPATKSETTSSYVLEPKPSKIKEKKKKEKKEKKLDETTEEKERRLSLELGEMDRKSSLKAEEKDSKYLPRAEEKHKHPFKHLRDRLRHAFSVNKES